MAAAKLEAADWLNWSEEKMNEFQYDCGIAWLKHYLQYAADADMVSGTREFWNWWRLQWYLRDKEWLNLCQQAYWANKTGGFGLSPEVREKMCKVVMPDQRKSMYRLLHQPDVLADERTEEGARLAASYAKDCVPCLR